MTVANPTTVLVAPSTACGIISSTIIVYITQTRSSNKRNHSCLLTYDYPSWRSTFHGAGGLFNMSASAFAVPQAWFLFCLASSELYRLVLIGNFGIWQRCFLVVNRSSYCCGTTNTVCSVAWPASQSGLFPTQYDNIFVSSRLPKVVFF